MHFTKLCSIKPSCGDNVQTSQLINTSCIGSHMVCDVVVLFFRCNLSASVHAVARYTDISGCHSSR